MLVEMAPSPEPLFDGGERPRGGIEIRLRFPSDPLAVRSALGGVLHGLGYADLPDEVRGALELVLAEALNNVVIHAHADRSDGMIEVRVLHDGQPEPVLSCELIDDGRPMPDGAMPLTHPAELGGDTGTLPEGGFGWLLIREFARDLDYERRGGCNRLTFHLDAAPPGPGRAEEA